MSYNNFISTVWSEKVQKGIESYTSFWDDCNHEFEGEVKQNGKVKILGVGRPTIGKYAGSIGEAEEVKDAAVYVDINQANYFNFAVDDVDKAQSTTGLMPALMDESAEGLAEKREVYIASLLTAKGLPGSEQKTIATEAEAKALVDEAFVQLWANGVKVGSSTVLTLAPWFYNLFKNNLVSVSTDNVKMLQKGIVGMYNGAAVKVNNMIQQSGGYDCMVLRTKKAMAAVGQVQETEAYRPEKGFKDAVKGLDVFGANIIRPKELYVLRAQKG